MVLYVKSHKQRSYKLKYINQSDISFIVFYLFITSYRKNYLQLELFYKTLTDKKVTQQKAYEYPALLSNLNLFILFIC